MPGALATKADSGCPAAPFSQCHPPGVWGAGPRSGARRRSGQGGAHGTLETKELHVGRPFGRAVSGDIWVLLPPLPSLTTSYNSLSLRFPTSEMLEIIPSHKFAGCVS